MALLGLVKKLMTPRGLLLAGILALVLALGVACGQEPTATPLPTSIPTPTPTATPLPTSIPTPTPAPSPAAAMAAFPLVIMDSNGKEVTFERPPQRIVAYDSAAVEFLYAMGEGHRIVGAHTFATYPPEAEAIPKVGDAFNINFEKIVELEPDLIYIFYGSPVPELEKLGIKVLYLETPDDLAGIGEQICMWGRIVGNLEKGEEVAKGFEARVKELQDKLTSIKGGPRVFHDLSDFWTAGPDTLIGEIYSLLKVENIAQDVTGYAQLSPEVIVERDPQVVIATVPGGAETFQGNPAFSGVSAVKEGRVYTVDAGPISVAGLRTVDGIDELARLIYPELFPAGTY